MKHKKAYALIFGVLAFSVFTIVKAQTQTPDSGEILRSVRDNLNRTRSMQVRGSADSTLDTRSISNNILFRTLAPSDWMNVQKQIGIGFNGTISKSGIGLATTTTSTPAVTSTPTGTTTPGTTTTSTGRFMTRWEITPFSMPFATGTADGRTSSTSFSVVTDDGTVYISASELLRELERRGLLATSTLRGSTSSDWVAVRFPESLNRIDRALGTDLSGRFEEKRDVIMDAVANPGEMFRVTSTTTETLNGRNVYRFELQGTERFLNEFYGATSTVGTGTSTAGNRSASGTLWVDRDTLLPTRLVFNTRLSQGNQVVDRFNLDANFGEFDREVNITVPTMVRSIESVLREVFQRLSNMFDDVGIITPIPTPTTTPPGTTTTPRTSTPIFPLP